MYLNGPRTLSALAVTAGTPVQIQATDGDEDIGFTILPTNGNIHWGDSGVTTANGQALTSGQSATLITRFPSRFWVSSDVGTVDVRAIVYEGVR